MRVHVSGANRCKLNLLKRFSLISFDQAVSVSGLIGSENRKDESGSQLSYT